MSLAVVLGGGGAVGIAWEFGLVLGLRDGGVHLADADLIVGTSAGSIVGALLATHTIDDFYGYETHQDADLRHAEPQPNMDPFMAAFLDALQVTQTAEGIRKQMGQSALAAKIAGEAERLQALRERLPEETLRRGWPERDHLRLTAIDAQTGELRVWTRDSGVPLLEAIASSCAVPCVFPLVHIGGRPYMDGGIGTPTNATLATGFDTVIVADPIGHFMGARSPLIGEKVELEQGGSRVIAVLPDERAASLFGQNFMDPAKRIEIATAGRDQGRALAAEMGR